MIHDLNTIPDFKFSSNFYFSQFLKFQFKILNVIFTSNLFISFHKIIFLITFHTKDILNHVYI